MARNELESSRKGTGPLGCHHATLNYDISYLLRLKILIILTFKFCRMEYFTVENRRSVDIICMEDVCALASVRTSV